MFPILSAVVEPGDRVLLHSDGVTECRTTDGGRIGENGLHAILVKHLGETHDHARRIRERLDELEQGRNPVQVFVDFAETLISQSLALSKTPFDLLRGSAGEEKVLKNATDACATEALEIATYAALRRLAAVVGDEQTPKLAASILGDEERMLERTMREIPELTDAVIGADVNGRPSYDITKTGAADATREAASEVKQTARATKTGAKRTARQASSKDAAPWGDPGTIQMDGVEMVSCAAT